MDKDLISLLKSSDPFNRIKGINRLVSENHPDAKRVLSAMNKTETDDSVKQALQDAARQLKATSSATKRDPQQAQKYLEGAMSALIDLRNDEAWDLAAKAFRADPSLAEDDYAIGLAGEITGKDRMDAINALLSGAPTPEGEDALGGDGKPKRKRKNEDGEPAEERVGWGRAMAGVMVYAVIVAVVISLPFFLFGAAIDAFIQAFDPSASAGGVGIGFGIGVLIGALIMVPIGVLIQYSVVHFSAKQFLSGEGYLTNLLKNITVPLIAQFVVQAVFFVIIVIAAFGSLASIDPAALEAAAATGDVSNLGGDTTLLNGLNALNSLIGLGFFIWMSMVVGKTYGFGAVKGCLSLVISGILMAVVVCGCYFVIIVGVIGGASASSGGF